MSVAVAGPATAMWINVASSAAGATCEASSVHLYSGWHFSCDRAIDRYLHPHYSWIPNGVDADPWMKVG